MSPITFTGLTKKFIWIFPYHIMQKLEWTFWPTQCSVVIIDFITWFSLQAITFGGWGTFLSSLLPSLGTVAVLGTYIGATRQAAIISRLAVVYRGLKF